MLIMNLKEAYNGKKILITGGLGFIGSNLAIKLVDFGADVTIMDARLKPYGFNEFNIFPIEGRVKLDFSDIRDRKKVEQEVQDKDLIFNLAAQLDSSLSLKEPLLDIDINCCGTINVLEACKNYNPGAKIIFPGSRMQYGRIKTLPVKESHPMNPLTIYATDKVTAESYHRIYYEQFGLDTTVLRLTNPYGPMAQIKNPAYAIVSWFIRQSLEGKDITIYGKGEQKRDYIYIDDLTEVFALMGLNQESSGKAYNLGSGTSTSLDEIANKIVDITKSGRVIYVPWPQNAKNIETGDFVADVSAVRKLFNWEPKFSIEEGLKRTIEFYRENINHYL